MLTLLKSHKVQLLVSLCLGLTAGPLLIPRPNPEIRTVVRVEEKIVEKKGEVRERVVWKDKEGNVIEKETVRTIEVKVAEKKADKVSSSVSLPRYEIGVLLPSFDYSKTRGYASVRLGNLPLKAASTFGIGVFTIGVVYEW